MWSKAFQKLVDGYDDTFQGRPIDHDHLFYDHPDDRLPITEETTQFYKDEVNKPESGLRKVILGNQIPASDFHNYAKKHNIRCLQAHGDFSRKYMAQLILPSIFGEHRPSPHQKHQDDLELILYCSIRSLQLMRNVFGPELKEYVDKVEICEATHPQKSDLFRYVRCTDQARIEARDHFYAIMDKYKAKAAQKEQQEADRQAQLQQQNIELQQSVEQAMGAPRNT